MSRLCESCGGAMVYVQHPGDRSRPPRWICPDALAWLIWGEQGPHPVRVFNDLRHEVFELGVIE